MPVNPDTSWWNDTLWKTDPLYNEIAFGASGLQFFLGHHTFTHENLNNVTYNDAEQQIRLNQVRCQLPFRFSRCSTGKQASQAVCCAAYLKEHVSHILLQRYTTLSPTCNTRTS